MESKILDCAQGIFDRVDTLDISLQPRALEEIAVILGRHIWMGKLSICEPEKRWISDDLEHIIKSMTPSDLQSTHVLVYGRQHSRDDLIPF